MLPTSRPATSSALVAQRLIRRLCTHCRQGLPSDDDPDAPRPGRQTRMDKWRGVPRRRAANNARHTGYKGAAWRSWNCSRWTVKSTEFIARRATGREDREAARRTGFHTPAEDTVARVLAGGEFSLDEISRVVDLTGPGVLSMASFSTARLTPLAGC